MAQFEVIIVGGGIAGSAAALRAVQNGLKTAWILGDADTRRRSRAEWVVNIDNMIGIHDGIVRKKLAKELKAHREARAIVQTGHSPITTRDIVENTIMRIRDGFGDFIELVEERAESAAASNGAFEVRCTTQVWRAPHLVLAMGVMDEQPKIKKTVDGEVVDDPQWIYPFANRETALYCLRCEGHLTRAGATAVIGSNEDAAYTAVTLFERFGTTTFVLTNGEEPRWSANLERARQAYAIECHRPRIVDLVGKKGRLEAVHLEDGIRLPASFVFVCAGLHRVYNQLAVDLGAKLTNEEEPTEVRHVLIDETGETSVKNLFAVGDMTRLAERSVMKQIYTAQEYAVRAVDRIDRKVRRNRREAAIRAHEAKLSP